MSLLNLEYIDIFDENRKKELIFSKYLIKEPFNKNSLFANLVDGQSMQPVINHKAVIVSDLSQKELIHNKIYLVHTNNKMWIKKYNLEKEIFFSLNPKYSNLIYSKDDVHVIARVLLTFTNL